MTIDPTMLLNCFNMLAGCITAVGTQAVITPGSDKVSGDGNHMFPDSPVTFLGDCPRVRCP